MQLTKEQIDMIIPDLKQPMSEDEYLTTLKVESGNCVDYGEIMVYDADKDRRNREFAKSMIAAE